MAVVIGAVVGAIFSGLSGASKKKNAKKLRNLENARIRAQTKEQIRRRTGEFEREESGGLALAGASGFAKGGAGKAAESGGFAKILEDMRKEFNLEVDWLNKSAEAGIDVTNQAYRGTARSIDFDTAGSVVGGFLDVGETKGWWT